MKITFDVKNQILTRTDRNQVIANSSDFLEADINFSSEWASMDKTMTFKNGNLVYTYVLTNDKVLQEQHLNLGVGTWKVSIIGVAGDQKVVTNECNLSVNASGWIGAPDMPSESVFEQLLVILQSLHTEAASTAVVRSAVAQYIADHYDELVKEAVVIGDVQEVIDDMVGDGTFGAIVAEQMEPYAEAAASSQVADWLEDNVDPDTGYVIDASLTTSLAAADAKATGDAIAEVKDSFVNDILAEFDPYDIGTLNNGRYILVTDGKSAASANWSYSDFLALKDAKAFLLTCPTNTNNIALQYVGSIAFYSSNNVDDFISAEPIKYGTDGKYTWLCISVPQSATYFRVSVWAATATDYQIVPIPQYYDAKNNIEKLIGYKRVSVTFSSANQVIASDLDVKVGCVYKIKVTQHYSEDYADGVNIFSNGAGGSANFVSYYPFYDSADFPCGVDGKLAFFNFAGYIGSVSFDVYWNLSRPLNDDPITYIVANSGGHTSLTELLLQLKDDTRPKKIIIKGGDYNIFSEYKALQAAGKIPSVPLSDYNPSTEYVPYNVFVPDNTHIIGEGLVRLLYEPTAESTYANEAETLSPLNIAGSCIIENIEIYCKNGRYAIHDDPIRDPQYNGAVKKYINVKAVKESGTLGYVHCFGCGVSREMTYIFENCVFENENGGTARTFYFHDRAIVGGISLQKKMSSRIIASNCKFLSTGAYSVFFGNIGVSPAIRIRVDLNNCYVQQAIVAADENNSATGLKANSFDITALFCKYGNLVVRDASNPYPPKAYSY